VEDGKGREEEGTGEGTGEGESEGGGEDVVEMKELGGGGREVLAVPEPLLESVEAVDSELGGQHEF